MNEPNVTPERSETGFRTTRELTIEWGHCDPAGIVFNPRFFEYFDWSTAMLLEVATGHAKPALLQAYGLVGIPLVATEAAFLAPARYGDRVRITSTVVEVGRSSFAVRHRLTNGDATVCEGLERRVWAGHHPDRAGSMKAKAIPEDLARLLRDGA